MGHAKSETRKRSDEMGDNQLLRKFRELKSLSGTHSPSIDVLIKELDIRIKVDACFLSNPYATDLFLEHFYEDFVSKTTFRDLLEHYPPQNKDISKRLSQYLKVSPENIFIGNGAIEIIQAILHNFVKGRISIPLPTFSSYYEFVRKDTTEVFHFQLREEDDFRLNAHEYLRFVRDNRINNVVLINPNNPDGSYVSQSDLVYLLTELKDIDNFILDESFIHFAFEDDEYNFIDLSELIYSFPNLTIIKSMSKDFGIAGIRSGYALTRPEYVSSLLDNGYLWNVNGFSSYFFKLYVQEGFQKRYEQCRKEYIRHTQKFYSDLSRIQGLRVYPSKANFFLMKTPEGYDSTEYMLTLLDRYGLYVRDCSDKLGLGGNYIRVASRREEENTYMIECFAGL